MSDDATTWRNSARSIRSAVRTWAGRKEHVVEARTRAERAAAEIGEHEMNEEQRTPALRVVE